MLRPGQHPDVDKAIENAKNQIIQDVKDFLDMLEKDIRSGLFLKCAKYDGQQYLLVNQFMAEINAGMEEPSP
jgi:hypothetical protein